MTRGRREKQSGNIESNESGLRHDQGGARRVGPAAIVGAVIVCLALGGLAAVAILNRTSGNEGGPRAAIVDQLGSRTPDQSFVDSVTSQLEKAGYAVDYYPGETVNVATYRDLATHDYKLIILRSHSAVPSKDLTLPTDVDPAIVARIMKEIGDDVLLFTSERYDSSAYLDDQRALRLFPVVYAGDPMSDTYFAVASGFIESNMKGRLDGTTVILMGCSSLATEKTAAAFVDRGAEAVVGWSDTVSPDHTDAATERLLQYMLKDDLTPAQAIEKVNADLGPDPEYGAVMKDYPSGN